MASIHKDGKNYYIHIRNAGKQTKINSRSSSKRIAERLKIQIEDELAANTFRLSNYVTRLQKGFKEFLDEANSYSTINKSESTVIREQRVLSNFIGFCGDISLMNIDVKMIENYKAFLKIEKGFSPNGINLELRHLSAVFSLAEKYDYINKNPFKHVSKVKVPKKLPLFLSKDQAELLLSSTKSYSVYSNILIALFTGARAEETVNLKWNDLDWDSKILILEGKGKKERSVPIPSRLYSYLLTNRKYQGFVCPGTRNPGEVSKHFRKYADRIGLEEFTFHNLRDTYASWLVQNGVNLKIIQELLGHESITTTLIYAHLSPDNKFQATKVIDQILPDDKSVTNMLPFTKRKAQ